MGGVGCAVHGVGDDCFGPVASCGGGVLRREGEGVGGEAGCEGESGAYFEGIASGEGL